MYYLYVCEPLSEDVVYIYIYISGELKGEGREGGSEDAPSVIPELMFKILGNELK